MRTRKLFNFNLQTQTIKEEKADRIDRLALNDGLGDEVDWACVIRLCEQIRRSQPCGSPVIANLKLSRTENTYSSVDFVCGHQTIHTRRLSTLHLFRFITIIIIEGSGEVGPGPCERCECGW